MEKRYFHKFKVRMLTFLGFALDIRSRKPWPAYALSNFYHNSFMLDGVSCRSMEGFLQGLKCQNQEVQIRVCNMRGKRAKFFGIRHKNSPVYNAETNGVFWQGVKYNRHGEEFQQLLRRAYSAMFDQAPRFREALEATGTKHLYHSIGSTDPHKTILTEQEFCSILTELRTYNGNIASAQQ